MGNAEGYQQSLCAVLEVARARWWRVDLNLALFHLLFIELTQPEYDTVQEAAHRVSPAGPHSWMDTRLYSHKVVLSRTCRRNASRVNLTIISFVMTTASHPDANTWLSHPECFICLPSTCLLMWFFSLSYLPSLPFSSSPLQIPLHTATITTLHTRKEILHLMWHLWHWSHYSRNRLFIKQLHFLCDILWSANNQ